MKYGITDTPKSLHYILQSVSLQPEIVARLLWILRCLWGTSAVLCITHWVNCPLVLVSFKGIISFFLFLSGFAYHQVWSIYLVQAFNSEGAIRHDPIIHVHATVIASVARYIGIICTCGFIRFQITI